MIPRPVPPRRLTPCLLLALLLRFDAGVAGADVEVARIVREPEAVRLEWSGGRGPYLVEVSRDLVRWTDQGEPAPARQADLPAAGGPRFYRVRDLDPEGLLTAPFGLVETEQSEFNPLFARHRLKSRLGFHLTSDPAHTGASHVPAEFWRRLWVHYQHLDDGAVRTWAGRLGDLGAMTVPDERRLLVEWSRGTGPSRRVYRMTLEFPYPVQVARPGRPFVSDPSWTLECTHASPQPELEALDGRLATTRTDSVRLIQLAPPDPDLAFLTRKYEVVRSGVRISLHFREGMPLYQGEVPWILKTYPFERWLAPTVCGGGGLPAFSVDGYFARTVVPGHHNFYHVVMLEPALDPAISDATLAALTASNIRQIYTFKDGADIFPEGEAQDIRYFGFDDSIRRP